MRDHQGISIQVSRRIAASIEARMRKLQEVAGSTDVAGVMTVYLPDLRQIWKTCSNEQLELLYRAYPLFHQYSALVEVAGRRALEPGTSLTQLSRSAAKADDLLRDLLALFQVEREPGWRQTASEIFDRYSTWLDKLEHIRSDFRQKSVNSRYTITAAVLVVERLALEIETNIRKLRGGRLPPSMKRW